MAQTVEYYLSKGFDKKVAEYFALGRRTPIKVEPQENYKLIITFDNGEVRILDVLPLLERNTIFSVLYDKAIFNSCYIDSNHSVCWDKDQNINSEKLWSNKIDISADTCYLNSETLTTYPAD